MNQFSHPGDNDHPDTLRDSLRDSNAGGAATNEVAAEAEAATSIRDRSGRSPRVTPAEDSVSEDDIGAVDPGASYVLAEPKQIDWRATKRLACWGLLLSTCLGLVIFLAIMLGSLVFLREDEQYVLPTLYGEKVWNGPATLIMWPHIKGKEEGEVRKCPRLANLEFAVLRNQRTQELRHILGPGLVWREPNEDVEQIRAKFQLQKTQYHRLMDSLTGEERIVRGPLVYAPEPLEAIVNGTEEALMINAQAAIVVENKTSGMKTLVRESGLFYPSPYEVLVGWRYAMLVQEQYYAVVKNQLNGTTFVQEGPSLLMLDAYEELVRTDLKIVVKKDEYLRLVDRRTGTERVAAGPAAVAPQPEEDMPVGVSKAAVITPNTAAVLLDHSTGQKQLRTAEGLLMPTAYQEILEIRPKIRVLAHQALLSRSASGALTLHSDSSFFLQPYDDIFSMSWSVYTDANQTEPAPREKVALVDLRTRRLPWSFIASTADNVRLRLEGATLWRVTDLLATATNCEDAPGDVMQRSRAMLLSAVGSVKLRDFTMRVAELSSQTAQALATDAFISQRGLAVLGMTVTRFEPVDSDVGAALLSMIIEVTQHVVQLERAHTDDDVNMSGLIGDLRIEQLRKDLIRTRAVNDLSVAIGEGQAQGARMAAEAKAFLDGLNETVLEGASRVDLYRSYHQEFAVNNLTKVFAGGPSKLYLHAHDTEIILKKAIRRTSIGAVPSTGSVGSTTTTTTTTTTGTNATVPTVCSAQGNASNDTNASSCAVKP